VFYIDALHNDMHDACETLVEGEHVIECVLFVCVL
jgi:hypothetical protein